MAILSLLGAAVDARAQVVQQREAWRPPALEATNGCEVWQGPGSGNDPTVLFELQLCALDGSADRVAGKTQYSGKSSGWSMRSVAGEWTDGRTRLRMHEDAIVAQQPSPGWRFCTCDLYDLALDGNGHLVGTYESEACHDHGRLSLVHVGDAPPAPVRPVVVPPTEPAKKHWFSCASAAAPPGSAAALFVAAAVVLARAARGRKRRFEV